MSTQITRTTYKNLFDSISKINLALNGALGDLDKNPGVQLSLEALLAKLRISTFYHDNNISLKDNLTFGVSDTPLFATQGYLDCFDSRFADSSAGFTSPIGFPQLPATTPRTWLLDGPCCTEGWEVWDYNSWFYYNLAQTPIANTNNAYLNKNNTASTGETGSVNRLGYSYPVAWTGSSFARVHLWETARIIAINNSTGSAYTSGSYQLDLDSSYFQGCRTFRNVINSDLIGAGSYTISQMPVDFTLTTFGNLYFNKSTNQYVSQPNAGTIPIQINNFRIYFDTTKNLYTLTFSLTSTHITDSSWSNGIEKLFIMYFGDADTQSYTKAGSTPTQPAATILNSSDVIIGPRKSFFYNKNNSLFTWSTTSPYNGITYLIANNYSNAVMEDGSAVFIDPPSQYIINQTYNLIPSNSIPNSLNGIASLTKDQYMGVVLVAITQGASQYMQYEFLLGPPVEAKFTQADWEKFKYFPEIPNNYIALAKFIVKGSNDQYRNNVLSNVVGRNLFTNNNLSSWNGTFSPTLQDIDVVWSKQVPYDIAEEPLGSLDLVQYTLPALYSFVVSLRSGLYEWLNNYAQFLITVGFADVNPVLADTTSSFVDPNSIGSILFRNYLKAPVDNSVIARLPNEPLAIQFNSDERISIADFCGVAPSTELVRFDSNNLYLTNQWLPVNAPLEIFLQSSDQCNYQGIYPGGTGVTLDYTLRLYLQAYDTSVIIKDWYIDSSLYYLNQDAYNRRLSLGQSVAGYYTSSTLNTINEWSAYGYAGVVPDLFMGESRPLYMREVNPPGTLNRPPTEEEYTTQLQDQGYTASQIADMIQQYLDEGNVFYVIDTREHEQSFIGVQSVAMNITQYTISSIPYWSNNIESSYGNDSGVTVGNENQVNDYTQVRADSFTIAPSGLSPGILETRYTYQDPAAAISDSDLIQNPRSGIAKIIEYDTAFAFNTSEVSTITSIGLPLAIELNDAVAAVGNVATQGLILEVYLDNNGIPGSTLLSSSDLIPYSAIPVFNYTLPIPKIQFTFGAVLNLDANASYWSVVRFGGSIVGGRLISDSNSVDNSTSAPTQIPSNPITTGTPLNDIDWSNRFFNGGTWLIGTGVPLLTVYNNSNFTVSNLDYTYVNTIDLFTAWVGESFAIPIKYTSGSNSIASISLQIQCDFTTLLNSDNDVIVAEIHAASGTQPSDSIMLVSGSNYAISSPVPINSLSSTQTLLEFTFPNNNIFAPTHNVLYWIVLKKYNTVSMNSVEVIGGNILIGLRNTTISKIGHIAQSIDGAWLPDTNLTQLLFRYQTPLALGAFNRSDIPQLPGPNNLREQAGVYTVDGYWSWTANELPYTQEISLYPRAVYDGTEYQWVDPNSNIYFVVRKKLDGEIQNVYGSLSRYPAWQCFWVASTVDSVQNMDGNFTGGFDLNNSVIKFINSNSLNTGVSQAYYQYNTVPISPNIDYYRARFVGSFAPLLSEQTYYYIQVVCRDGVRVTFNDSYIINNWQPTNAVIETNNSSAILLTNGVFYPLQVDYFLSRAPTEAITTDTPIEVKWFSHGWEETWTVNAQTQLRTNQEKYYNSGFALPSIVTTNGTAYTYVLKHYLALNTSNTYQWSISVPKNFVLKINGVVINADTVSSLGFTKISLTPNAGGGDTPISNSNTLTQPYTLVFNIVPVQELYTFEIDGGNTSASLSADKILISSYVVTNSGNVPTAQQTLLSANDYGFIDPNTSYSVGHATPISLGYADSIVYIGVGKTMNDISDANYGAPPGDLLIIRSQ